MRISLLTVPVEPDYMDFLPEVRPDTDVFVTKTRSQGQLPVMPKIAIVSLVKWMESHGYTASDYDFYDVDMLLPSDRELLEYFEQYRPEVVGLSAVVSTCYAQVKRIAALVRKACPDAWIVVGGSITASSNLVLHKTNADLCIVGDGEIPWVEFLDYVKSHGRAKKPDLLGVIKGLAYLNNAGEIHFTGYGKAIPGELNPFPDYDLLLKGLKNQPEALANYFRPGLGSTHVQTDPRSYEPHRRPMLAQLWSSKGCVARCTFCQRSTKGYRVLGIEALDVHLKELAERFNVGYVHVLDENFASVKDYAYEFARTMKKHDMLWMASGIRVTSLEREDIAFFKEHNCVSLKFGVESGSQKIMDVMEKKFTTDRVFQTLKHCADFDIYSPLAVMVGMPGETNQTARETGTFLGRLAHMQGIEPKYLGIAIFYALPLTGTPLYVYGQQVGVIGKTPDKEEEFLMSVSGTGASKVNYINLNGAKIKNVVWWDWLVKLEAQHTFHALCLKTPMRAPGFLQKVIVEDKIKEIVGKPLSLREILRNMKEGGLRGLKVKVFYFIGEFMERTVIPSRFVARLPRALVYPVLQNLVYFEFVMQRKIMRVLKKPLNFNLWKQWNPVDPLTEVRKIPVIVKKINIAINADRSLRKLVREVGKSQAPKSNAERAQDVLSVGL